MKKIKELYIGEVTDITLVVASATARETRAKKPYLQLSLYDGTDTISGNYWDWASGKIPDKNSIVDVSCQVTEYMGTKQLNIKALKLNTTRHISEFEPSSGVDIASTYKEAYAEAATITDDFLRELCLSILESLRTAWLTVPGAKGVHHAFVGGTLVHSLSVAKIAQAISSCILDSNDDLCFAGGLLHDLGKLYTYRLNGIAIDITNDGMLYDHTFIGAEFVGNFAEENGLLKTKQDYGKLQLLRHIILSHHGKLEYGAAVTPMCIEAHIVHNADSVDASTQQIIEQSSKVNNAMWTERIFALGNRPQITPEYTSGIFAEATNDEYDMEDDPPF